MKNTFKIIGLYILGALCIVLFFFIDNSDKLEVFIEKADDFRTHWGFGLYAVVGLIKLISIIGGMTLLVAPTALLIRQRIKKNAL